LADELGAAGGLADAEGAPDALVVALAVVGGDAGATGAAEAGAGELADGSADGGTIWVTAPMNVSRPALLAA
jgi:hypothetical protein